MVTASSFTDGSLYSQRAGLHVELLAVAEVDEEHVAVSVQPHERVAVRGAELVHEEARAAEQHVLHALDAFEAVVEVVGGGEELVLAHVERLRPARRCSGTHWPGESREKAMRPEPEVRVTKKSSPAILRLTPPGSFFSSMFSCVSFHSSVWCSNITG